MSRQELEAGLAEIRQAPAVRGTLEMIVRRPTINRREVLNQGELNPAEGLAGDSWSTRPSSRTPDKSPHPHMQLNIMGARAIALLARTRDRWPLAGDQLFVDFDLSEANLPAGSRLQIGAAVVEVTSEPHTGCGKFLTRFGVDAMKFVNAPGGRALRLRGLNARVVTAGAIRVGDVVQKLG